MKREVVLAKLDFLCACKVSVTELLKAVREISEESCLESVNESNATVLATVLEPDSAVIPTIRSIKFLTDESITSMDLNSIAVEQLRRSTAGSGAAISQYTMDICPHSLRPIFILLSRTYTRLRQLYLDVIDTENELAVYRQQQVRVSRLLRELNVAQVRCTLML